MHSLLPLPLVVTSYALVYAALGAAALSGGLAAALVLFFSRRYVRGPQGPMGLCGPRGRDGAPGLPGRDAEQHTLDTLTALRTKWRALLADNLA